jgi:hypothetical protein
MRWTFVFKWWINVQLQDAIRMSLGRSLEPLLKVIAWKRQLKD